MTHTKDLIDFIYQNILLFHFKALSLCTLNERFLFTLHFKSKTTTNQPLTTYKTVHSIQSISFLNKNWQIFKYNFHEKPDILALFPCQLKPCQLRKLSLRNLSKSQYAVIFEYIKAIV